MHYSCSSTVLSKCASVTKEINKLSSTLDVLKTISDDENVYQDENLCRLQDHAKLVHRWKINVETRIASLDEEILYLTNRRNCLSMAIASLKIAANTNAECSWCRITKLDGDYHDEIEVELDKEKFLISGISAHLETSRGQIDDYLKKLKVGKSNLEFEWSKKVESYNVECDNIRLNQLCANTMLRYGAARSLNRDTTSKEWKENVECCLNRAETLLLEAFALHICIDDNILRKHQRELHEQAQKIDIAFTRKTSITRNYLEKLEKNLKLIINKQNELETMMEKVEITRNGIKKSLKLVQTRLSNRLEKPFSEQIYDQAQNGLLAEVENIHAQELTLQQKITRIGENLKELISVKIEIERELQLKENNLWIDGNQCPQIRNHFPSSAALTGFQFGGMQFDDRCADPYNFSTIFT